MARRTRLLIPTKKKSIVAKQIDKGTGKLIQVGLGVTAAAINIGSVKRMIGKLE